MISQNALAAIPAGWVVTADSEPAGARTRRSAASPGRIHFDAERGLWAEPQETA